MLPEIQDDLEGEFLVVAVCPLKSGAVIMRRNGKVIPSHADSLVVTVARLFWERFSLCFL